MSRRLLRCGYLLSQPHRPRLAPQLSTSRPTASPSLVNIPGLHRPIASFSAPKLPSATMSRSHPLTTAVVDAMQELYPLEYADSAWDNVGLLLDNLAEPAEAIAAGTKKPPRVLLTIDLTSDVVDEAIEHDFTVIVAYHPFIFRGLKSVTNDDPQQASLLRLVQNNISVYSPHTALDAAEDGINEWLISKVREATQNYEAKSTVIKKVAANPATLPPYIAEPIADGRVGYGRQMFFPDKPVSPWALIRDFVCAVIGIDSPADSNATTHVLRHVLVAEPRKTGERSNRHEPSIRSVAVCAGSGMDILRAAVAGAAKEQRTIDMFITGEISHHDALWASANGIWVVCLLHSNSERGFLVDCLRERLEEKLKTTFLEQNTPEDAQVMVSMDDRDPFQIWNPMDGYLGRVQ